MSLVEQEVDKKLLTGKQIALLKVIVEGNRDENGNFSPCDLDQIMERLPHKPIKASLQFSIRFLIKKGMLYKGGLEYRRGFQRRRTIYPTQEAIDLFTSPLKKEDYVSDFELEEI
jgi:hypothetical protein